VSSRRDVPILIPELNAAIQAADHTKPVVSYGPNSIADAVNNVCQKNNLPQVGVHGLRHSFASLCYHLEVPEKVVMQLGGWSDNGTMRKIYTHLAKKDVMKNVDVLRDFFQIGHESGHAKGNCQ
jgi:integrase